MTEAGDPPRIHIDTSIFLVAFEGSSIESDRLKAIFAGLRSKPGMAVTNEFTLGELFGKEAPQGWIWQRRFYLNLIVFGTLFDLRPLTRELLIATGPLRKVARDHGRSIKLGDAIHLGTARQAACTHLLTCDKRFVVPHPMSRLTIDEPGLATIEHLVQS